MLYFPRFGAVVELLAIGEELNRFHFFGLVRYYIFPLSSARVFSGLASDRSMVSMASLATGGTVPRSQLETVARVTPSKRARSV